VFELLRGSGEEKVVDGVEVKVVGKMIEGIEIGKIGSD
jgi:hypothetical protein